MKDLNTIKLRTEKLNSYEFGKAGNRFKLYFDEVCELNGKIEELKKTYDLNYVGGE